MDIPARPFRLRDHLASAPPVTAVAPAVASDDADMPGGRSSLATARPMDRDGFVDRTAPFALVAVVMTLVGLAGTGTEPVWAILALAFLAVTIAAALVVPWERLPAWADVVPPLWFLFGVATVRYAAGPGTTTYEISVLIPLVWAGLYCSRRQVWAVIVASYALMLGPHLVVGPPAYPTSDLRVDFLVVFAGGLVAYVASELTTRLRAAAANATEREARLAEQRELNRTFVREANDAIITLDAQGTIERWNPAAARLFGWQADDVIGRDVFEALIAHDDRPRLVAGMTRLLEGRERGSERRFDAWTVCADGSRLLCEVSISLATADGVPVIQATARDMTARHEAERLEAEYRIDLARLLAIARQLGRSDVDTPRVIAEQTRGLMGADAAVVYELGEAGDVVVEVGRSGALPQVDRVVIGPQSLSAHVIATREPAFSPDVVVDSRVDQRLVQRLGVRAGYWQPVIADGRVVGLLIAYWNEPAAEPTHRSRELLQVFAGHVAEALLRSKLVARLEETARTDGLTGAANRRALDETLAAEVADAARTGRALAVVMLDIDHFKAFNDTQGHQAGDGLLAGASGAWRAELRPGDTLARYGGEEFLVLLRGTPIADAVRVADRLRSVVPAAQTASAGVAALRPTDTPATLVARADAALYEAKARGRDRTVAERRTRRRTAGPEPATQP